MIFNQITYKWTTDLLWRQRKLKLHVYLRNTYMTSLRASIQRSWMASSKIGYGSFQQEIILTTPMGLPMFSIVSCVFGCIRALSWIGRNMKLDDETTDFTKMLIKQINYTSRGESEKGLSVYKKRST